MEAEDEGFAGLRGKLAGEGLIEPDLAGRGRLAERAEGQREEGRVHPEDLDAVGAGGSVLTGNEAREPQEVGADHSSGIREVPRRTRGACWSARIGLEEAVAPVVGSVDLAESGKGALAQAGLEGITDGKGADEDGGGHRGAQYHAEMGAGVEGEAAEQKAMGAHGIRGDQASTS